MWLVGGAKKEEERKDGDVIYEKVEEKAEEQAEEQFIETSTKVESTEERLERVTDQLH